MLCLQGGREFTDECVEMDRVVLHRSGASTVAVLAGAARVGSDYDGASERARRHYEQLGATVIALPDPRSDIDGVLDALTASIDLLVLPGGSPTSLLDVLSGHVRTRILDRYAAGMSISGASAGAMVLCEQMVRPDRGDVVDGLGLAPGLALPHWSPGPTRWQVPDVHLWGLPECGGVILDGEQVWAVGHGEPAFRESGTWTRADRLR